MKNLTNKKILFVICGGVSAYKSLETIRLFKKKNAEIKTILTKSAKEFVTPLSITSLSQGKVYDDLFSVENETEMDHIALSRWADVIIVAPITANTIYKLSQGSSEDLAAKGTKLLGIKAVIAESFERIHRSNLIGMGILPLQFVDGMNRSNLNLNGSELISVLNIENGILPADKVTIEIKYLSGDIKKVNTLCRIDTKNELEYYKNGGILQYVLRNMI